MCSLSIYLSIYHVSIYTSIVVNILRQTPPFFAYSRSYHGYIFQPIFTKIGELFYITLNDLYTNFGCSSVSETCLTRGTFLTNVT